MKKSYKNAVRANLISTLRFAVPDGDARRIVDLLLNEVEKAIDASGKEDFNADDVKQAVGHVLCKRLELR